MGGRKWRAACGAAFLWLVLGEKPKEGGRGLHCEGLGLGFFFCFFKIAPLPFCMCWKLLFIGKNVARSPNLVPQFFFFVNLIFFIVLDFSYQHRLEMRKIIDFLKITR
jgi:hypothetical protein